ncbi:hypothetical protein L083_1324 [Actinoplanes sp. N902-109]|nr:hypothetical protein L083_1324 [Actinoplanes sp. N902-109]
MNSAVTQSVSVHRAFSLCAPSVVDTDHVYGVAALFPT